MHRERSSHAFWRAKIVVWVRAFEEDGTVAASATCLPFSKTPLIPNNAVLLPVSFPVHEGAARSTWVRTEARSRTRLLPKPQPRGLMQSAKRLAFGIRHGPPHRPPGTWVLLAVSSSQDYGL
jgi:hypothetical protein